MSNPAAGYRTHRVKRNKPPDVLPTDAARRALRVLALMLVDRVDRADADLATMARQCVQTGELVLRELAPVTGGCGEA